jgi:hypothetical protein
MEIIWIVLICYGAVGLVIGVVLAINDMKYMNEPGEELVWIPLGIIAWPIFVGMALKRTL